MGVLLRDLRLDDLPLLAGWLEQPHVRDWWGDGGDTVDDARGVIEASDPLDRVDAVELDGAPVGFIQRFRISRYPDYIAEFTEAGIEVDPSDLTFDYLIGEPSAIGRGVGRRMLQQAIERTELDDPDARSILVPVHAENVASWRALRSAGFVNLPGVYDFEPDIAGHSREHVVLRHNFA